MRPNCITICIKSSPILHIRQQKLSTPTRRHCQYAIIGATINGITVSKKCFYGLADIPTLLHEKRPIIENGIEKIGELELLTYRGGHYVNYRGDVQFRD